MKTIKLLQDSMNNIQVQISTNSSLEDKEIKRMKKEYSFLALRKTYLETDPKLDFLEKERDRLINKINLIAAGYTPNEKLIEMGLRKEERAEYAEYHKIMNTKHYRDQYKAILFLLS